VVEKILWIAASNSVPWTPIDDVMTTSGPLPCAPLSVRRGFRRQLALTVFAVALISRTTIASAAVPEETWLSALEGDVRADIAEGRPVVVQAHVALCDNSMIHCGGGGRGDGDDLARNLYWATSEGLVGWMNRPGSGWTQELRTSGEMIGEPEVLEIRAWRRTLPVPHSWSGPGTPATFVVHVVGFAWRGTAIDHALAEYLTDVFHNRPRIVTVRDPAEGRPIALAAGGRARLVAWVGHNRLMDRAPDWAGLARNPETNFRKGTLAIACYSASYLRDKLSAPTRVPLLMTASLVMASSAAFESGVMAFLQGGDLRAIRERGAAGYAEGQHRPPASLRRAFTNPSDNRWHTNGL